MDVIDQKVIFAKEVITNTFSFMENMGYSMNCEIRESKVLNDWLNVTYINIEKNRKVCITYSEVLINNKISHSFGLSIIRKYGFDDENFFSLGVYLKSLGAPINSVFEEFNKQQVEKILAELAYALKTYAGRIINGEEWVNGMYSEW